MLYNTKKKLTDKEKWEIKSENEKLKIENKDLKTEIQKISEELKGSKAKVKQLEMNSGQSKGKIIMKPKKRLQAPTQKNSQQDQNPPEEKGGIPAPKITTEANQEGKHEIPPTRMTFSGGSRATFQKNSSENTSSQDNGVPVTIKPKVNNTSSIKAPLKNFGKKSETKKNDGKKLEKVLPLI